MKSGKSSRRNQNDFHDLSKQLLFCANRGLLRIEFLKEVLNMIMDFSRCDAVSLWLEKSGRQFRAELIEGKDRIYDYKAKYLNNANGKDTSLCMDSDPLVEKLCCDIISGDYDPALPYFTERGSFISGDFVGEPGLESYLEKVEDRNFKKRHGSILIIPVEVGDIRGILQLRSKMKNFFTREEAGLFEGVVENLGVALTHRRAQSELRERVKELTCLYGLARVMGKPGLSQARILQDTVELLPPAWLYPDNAAAKIIFDSLPYETPGFEDGICKMSADIVVDGEKRGTVEVAYNEEKPLLYEGPFLKEERSLLDVVAREISLFLERKQAEEERAVIQDQLRHADRLAKIGQLAAGVAHELNEPLGGILGFAQLAKKNENIPEQVDRDLDKIITASLHAREVIKKLMLFAREMPPRKTRVNLNKVIDEGLYFLASRCAKTGIDLEKNLDPDLPDITADASQLHQVLVNLFVNAVQAMPDGGRLTINTSHDEENVSLIVKDTGTGMTPEVMRQIFVPFYTTKDVDLGTGLGLPVVHGIVSSHGGFIRVESEPGKGSSFEVRLPIKGPQDADEGGIDGEK
ncbi:MAG: ATP-binding protein [Chloroflexi bacterium]|nr:ATP-binding protein [Chloroflexota bacterium]